MRWGIARVWGIGEVRRWSGNYGLYGWRSGLGMGPRLGSRAGLRIGVTTVVGSLAVPTGSAQAGQPVSCGVGWCRSLLWTGVLGSVAAGNYAQLRLVCRGTLPIVLQGCDAA